MARPTFVVVLCVLASAAVQSNHCPSGSECPSVDEPNHVLSLLQRKLRMKLLQDGGEETACGTDAGVGKVSGGAEAAMLTELKEMTLSGETPAFELNSVIKLLFLVASWVAMMQTGSSKSQKAQKLVDGVGVTKLEEHKSNDSGIRDVPLMKVEGREGRQSGMDNLNAEALSVLQEAVPPETTPEASPLAMEETTFSEEEVKEEEEPAVSQEEASVEEPPGCEEMAASQKAVEVLFGAEDVAEEALGLEVALLAEELASEEALIEPGEVLQKALPVEKALAVEVALLARKESLDEVLAMKVVPLAGGQVMERIPNDIPAPPSPPPGLRTFTPPPGLCPPIDATLESVGRMAAPGSKIQNPTSTTSRSQAGVGVSVDGTRRSSSPTLGQALAPSHVLSKKVESLIKCAKRHQDADAIAIFQEIKALGGNLALQDALKRGNVFGKVPLEQLAVEVFNLLVQCAGRTGQTELIDVFLQDMTSAGIKRTLAFYESTMNTLVSKKCYKQAMSIGSLLEADGLKPSPVMLSLIKGHAAEQLEVTLDLMQNVTQRSEEVPTPLNPHANVFVPITTTVDPQLLQHSAEEHLPSEGSVLHQQGACRPCIFAIKNKCQDGSQCSFCHYPHELPKRPERPGMNNRRRAMKKRLSEMGDTDALTTSPIHA